MSLFYFYSKSKIFKEEIMKFLPTLFLATILVVAFSAGVAQGDLILYFTFDSADGDTVPDMTGGGNDGTLDLAEIVSSPVKIGSGALQIENEDAVMTVESFPELPADQDHTYAFWLYFTAGHNDAWSQVIARKTDSSDRFPGVWINPGGTGLHIRYNPGNMGFSRIGPDGEGTDFPLNQWFHIAFAKEAANLTMYVDGVQTGDPVPVPAAHDAVDGSTLYIGKTGYRAATFIIDDLGIYDHALTQSEVEDIITGIVAVSPKGKLATTWASVKY
jgi:hypothetical protein